MSGQLLGGEPLGLDLARRRHPDGEPRPPGRQEQLCRAKRAPRLGQQRGALGRHGYV